MKKEIVNALIKEIDNASFEKKLDRTLIKEFLVDSVKKVYTKKFDVENLVFDIDLKNGDITSYVALNVIDSGIEDYDDFLEIPRDDPLISHLKMNVGEIYQKPFDLQETFSRHEVGQILQGFKQKIIEAINKEIYEEWKDKKNEIIYGEVEKNDSNGGVFVNIKKPTEKFSDDTQQIMAFLPYKEKNNKEKLQLGKSYPFVISEIVERSKLWPIVLSRKSDKLLEYYLTNEIPEIQDGEIKIIQIARMAGIKSKVIVKSASNIITEPVAICIGSKGARIKQISEKIGNEKIEIFADKENQLLNLLEVCGSEKIISIAIKYNEQKTKINSIILFANEDDFISIIGKSGNNIRLINRMFSFNIEIRIYSNSSKSELSKDYDYYLKEELISKCDEIINSLNNEAIVEEKIELDLVDPIDENLMENEFVVSDFEDDINKIINGKK